MKQYLDEVKEIFKTGIVFVLRPENIQFVVWNMSHHHIWIKEAQFGSDPMDGKGMRKVRWAILKQWYENGEIDIIYNAA